MNKVYEQGVNSVIAVKDINLEIKQGDIFGIIGYSGAGKSSLVRLLNGLEPVTKGKIFVDGQEITASTEREISHIRHSIGMIFQHFNLLWSRTVKENIEFPLEISGMSRRKRRKRVAELLKLVGLEDKENNYPSTLSGGQKQRVGIARALANNPRVLLCDEATSALDPQTTQTILSLLADINKKFNITIVLITHEMSVVKAICNKVAVLEKGEIVETGEVKNIFNNPQHEITQLFLSQTKTELRDLEDSQLIKLSLPNGDSYSFLHTLLEKFNVPIKLIKSDIDQNGDVLYLELAEKNNDILQYLEKNKFDISVISNE